MDDNNLNDADDGWKIPFRPFSVIVDVEVSDIVARLPFAPNYKLPTGGPLVKLNTIWFELDKHYQETRMQLIISDLDLTFDHIHSGVKVRPLFILKIFIHIGDIAQQTDNFSIFIYSFLVCNTADLHFSPQKDAKILIYRWSMHGCKKLKLENFLVMHLSIFL